VQDYVDEGLSDNDDNDNDSEDILHALDEEEQQHLPK
jgi:hypothetical protein